MVPVKPAFFQALYRRRPVSSTSVSVELLGVQRQQTAAGLRESVDLDEGEDTSVARELALASAAIPRMSAGLKTTPGIRAAPSDSAEQQIVGEARLSITDGRKRTACLLGSQVGNSHHSWHAQSCPRLSSKTGAVHSQVSYSCEYTSAHTNEPCYPGTAHPGVHLDPLNKLHPTD